MRFKAPKNSGRFHWTNHVIGKMAFYGLSEQRVKRVILRPGRIEEGIAPNTIACMQVAGSKKHRQEIWVMYQTKNSKLKAKGSKLTIISRGAIPVKARPKIPSPKRYLKS